MRRLRFAPQPMQIRGSKSFDVAVTGLAEEFTGREQACLATAVILWSQAKSL